MKILSKYVLISTIISISATYLVSIIFIRKEYYVRELKIFILLYTIGQLLGYGLEIDILKTVIPSSFNPETGSTFQIVTSIILPFLLAFTIKDIFNSKKELDYRFFIRTALLIIILMRIIQFTLF